MSPASAEAAGRRRGPGGPPVPPTATCRRPHRHGRESRTRRAPRTESEKQGREPEALAAGTPSKGTSASQWRRRRPPPERERAVQPIRARDLQRTGAEPLAGHRGALSLQAHVPKVQKSESGFWIALGSGFQPKLSDSTRGELREPFYACTTGRNLVDPSFCPREHYPGSLERAGCLDYLLKSGYAINKTLIQVLRTQQ